MDLPFTDCIGKQRMRFTQHAKMELLCERYQAVYQEPGSICNC